MNDAYVAISKYNRVIAILSKLCELYPNTLHSEKYADYINQYRVRVR